MRTGGCFFLLVLWMGLAVPAFAGEQYGCTGCGTSKAWRGLDAEACSGPCGYTLVPGCCEESRHCCDNAWAGYCEHRAKVDAFWAKVGVPGSCGRGCFSRPVRGTKCSTDDSCDSTCDAATPALQPTPATAPAPSISRDKVSRLPYTARTR